MKESFKELNSDETCPCGSERAYGECCRLKSFSFGRDEVGSLVRRVPLAPEVAGEMESTRGWFFDLYGRPPAEHDLVFGHVADPTDSVFSCAREMMRAGLDACYAYAYTRTDGLLLSEMNLDLVSERDVELFSSYVSEYKEATSEDAGGEAVSSLAFVALGNSVLSDVTTRASRKIIAVLTDFISRHLPDTQSTARMYPTRGGFSAFRVRTPLDYGLFTVLKAKKTLEGIARLADAGLPAAVFALARSIYESTLFLDAIATDKALFWKSVAPKADPEAYEFGTYPDGRTNFNHVVHRTTGEKSSVLLRVRDLALAPDRPTHVADLYSIFYVAACQYAHVDVLSAPTYFDDPDPFDQLDGTLIANLIALILAGDLVRALCGIAGVAEGFQQDAWQFLQRLRVDVEVAVLLVESDPEHPSEVMSVLGRVMDAWGD